MGMRFKGEPYYGLRTTQKTKRLGCSAAKGLIEEGNLLVNDSDIIDELDVFVKTGVSFAAEEGYHDDLVMCLVLFGWLSQQRYFAEMYSGSGSNRVSAFKSQIGAAESDIFNLLGAVTGPVKEVLPDEYDRVPDEFKWMFNKQLQTRTKDEWAALWSTDDD